VGVEKGVSSYAYLFSVRLVRVAVRCHGDVLRPCIMRLMGRCESRSFGIDEMWLMKKV
jgi:hypothetical protein